VKKTAAQTTGTDPSGRGPDAPAAGADGGTSREGRRMGTFNGKTPRGRPNGLPTRLLLARGRLLEGNDPKSLHDFRVALRRLRTCLRLFEGSIPARELRPLLEGLKHAGRSTNSLRDLEAFNELHSAFSSRAEGPREWRRWLSSLEEKRSNLEKKMKKSLASSFPVRRLSRLERDPAFRWNRRKTVLRMKREFKKERRKLRRALRAARRSTPGEKALHRIRAEAKRVRYDLEEFPFLMPRKGGKLASKCRQAQEALGEGRDLAQALQRLEQAPIADFPGTRRKLARRKTRNHGRSRKALRSLRGVLAKS
jgi:CHAD domain-containing protein